MKADVERLRASRSDDAPGVVAPAASPLSLVVDDLLDALTSVAQQARAVRAAADELPPAERRRVLSAEFRGFARAHDDIMWRWTLAGSGPTSASRAPTRSGV